MANKKLKKKIVDTSLPGISEFVDFVKGCNISALSIKEGNTSITVYQNKNAQKAAAVTSVTPNNEAATLPEKNGRQILSTFVGVYHPVKGIKPGLSVKAGEPLANIYSMNIEHQIKAAEDCLIEEILVNKNDLVDYGKPLFLIN